MGPISGIYHYDLDKKYFIENKKYFKKIFQFLDELTKKEKTLNIKKYIWYLQ